MTLEGDVFDPNSLSFTAPEIKFSLKDGKLEVGRYDDSVDSLTFCFTKVSPLLLKPISKRDTSTHEVYRYNQISKSPDPEIPKSIFETPGLQKSGAISRGITVGNRQNLFVNSSLNLQLMGKLTDSININAVITDQNVPFQPEGNTQQIRDFDKVYIQLYDDTWDLKAGDVVLQNEVPGYFLKYYKNQQGIQIRRKKTNSRGLSSSTRMSGAVAKGKFASTKVDANEGVLGPYKVQGSDGERFAIVVANSERVYLDGILMKRGFDQDYIIDYNLGEVTFNPGKLITRYSRIRIDFEFIQQSYPRTNLQFSHKMGLDKHLLYFDYYVERDNPDNPLNGNFSLEDLNSIGISGDDPQGGSVSGIDSVGFQENRILYRSIDTLDQQGQSATIYEYSANSSDAVYAISFTEVGLGNGDYELANSSSNGRIYHWVSPSATGERLGSFAPMRQVALPNSRQMGIVGKKVQLGQNLRWNSEVALSLEDKNTLSDRQDGDNFGTAYRTELLFADDDFQLLRGNKLDAKLIYEQTNRNFTQIDRFRSIDFDRDWSYAFPFDSVSTKDQLISASVRLRDSSNNFTSYQFKNRIRQNALDGNQHFLDLDYDLGRFKFKSNNFSMNNDLVLSNSQWRRSFNDIGLGFGGIQTGYFFNLDHNLITDTIGDVRASAMYFEENGVYLQGDSSTLQFRIEGGIRRDSRPMDGEISHNTTAKTFRLHSTPISSSNNNLKILFNYLQMNDENDDKDPTDNISGSVSAFNQLLGETFRSNLLYAVSNNRELRREFVYQLVGAGMGTHTWRDENEDGIQDLNEFYEAINPDERLYAKFFVPTDDYIDAFQNIFRQDLQIRPPRSWNESGSLRRMLSRAFIQINWNLNNKTTSSGLSKRINPFKSNTDSSAVYSKGISRYSFFVNRNRPGPGFVLHYTSRSFKQLNYNGFELSQIKQLNPLFRWNFSETYQLELAMTLGSRLSASDFLASRNFDLNTTSYTSSFSWSFLKSSRLSLDLNAATKTNEQPESIGETATLLSAGTSYKWGSPGNGSVNAGFEIVNIEFEGDENTYLGYTLLEALRPGTNVKLNLNWQQTLSNGLQLTVQYFGRKSEDISFIHSGSMHLTAFF